jgi:putative oxidoreductase
MTRLSSWFVASSPAAINRALLALRAALGVVFILHGWQKLAVFGYAGVTQMFTGLGLPLPALSAALVIAAELVGGLALLVGVFTRPAAVALAFTMLVALTQVHLANGFFLPNGFEYTFTLLLVNLAVVVAGPGAYSLDARLFGTSTSVRATAEPRWTHAA